MFEDVEIGAKNGDLGLGQGHGSNRSLFVTDDFAEEDRELEAHHHQETFDADALPLSGLEELELTFRDFDESSETEDGHDSVNVTRDEHDVDNVNDDEFYILNGNDYDPGQACSTEEHQSAMNLFAKAIPNLKKSGVLNNICKFLELVSDDIFPLYNTSFLLFLDTVNLFATGNASGMRYRKETMLFYIFGLLKFHGKWIRYCRGEKFSGTVLEDKENKGYFNPQLNKLRINFAMPFDKIL